MTNTTLFVQVEPDGKISYLRLIAQGVEYQPVEESKVNGLDKFTFALPLMPDLTPALFVKVVDSLAVGDKVGT